MRGSPRFWLKGLLVGALLAMQPGLVAAQIPNPLDTGVGQIPNPADVVEGTVQTVGGVINTATETVNNTVNNPAQTVGEAAGQVSQTVDGVQNHNPAGVVNQTAGGAAAGTSSTVATVGGAASQAKETGSGSPSGASPSGSAGDGGVGNERVYATAATAGGLQNWARARGLFSRGAWLGITQPSLAILVDAVNDADGDGIYSDAEIASEPRADVNFKALITNIGATGFEIAGVSHTYSSGNGPIQGRVCGELRGIMLAPGESLTCSFPVSDYSPARGDSLVNTVMAAAFEVGKSSRRGASDSDTTTVDTLVDEVLAVAIEREPGLLAFTGAEAVRLVGLALVLLVIGGSLLHLSRVRGRRPGRRLPAESSMELLGWWASGPERSRSKEEASIR